MQINFVIKPTDKLATGLNFQLLYAKEQKVKSWENFSEDDYQHSISVNDKAFNLVFANFYNHSNWNDDVKWGYAYGVNFHDKSSIQAIVKELNQLKHQIDNNAVPTLESRYFYTKKVQKILSNRRIRYKYQPKILAFLAKLIAFLQVAIDDDEILGIYVLGI